MDEGVDLFSVVLPIESPDVLTLSIDVRLYLVFLDIEVGRIFIFDQMVVLNGQNRVVSRRTKSLPELDVMWS